MDPDFHSIRKRLRYYFFITAGIYEQYKIYHCNVTDKVGNSNLEFSSYFLFSIYIKFFVHNINFISSSSDRGVYVSGMLSAYQTVYRCRTSTSNVKLKPKKNNRDTYKHIKSWNSFNI